MNSLKTTNPLALQYLMTEEMYAVAEDLQNPVAEISPIISPVVEEVKPALEVSAEPEYFDYLGENNKYMLIIINEVAHKNMQPKQLEALLNILKAKKMELKDVAILNFNNYPGVSFAALKKFFACNAIVIFGVNPAEMKIEAVQSNQITSHQETKILATYSFDEMMADTDKKRIFWNEMKKL